MSEILIHTGTITEKQAAKLEAQGVVAIKVSNLDEVRLLSVEHSSIRLDDFLWATLDAITAQKNYSSECAIRLSQNLRTLAVESRKRRELLENPTIIANTNQGE